MIGCQQERPESEKQLPEWQRSALDRTRAELQRDAAAHPAIMAALARIEQMLGSPAWQPIETAPRDGAAVLLYEGYEPIITQGYFDTDDKLWVPSGGHKMFWEQPTHWMPLPSPPVNP